MITAENAPVIQSLLNDVSKDKPAVGRTVRVLHSRKHFGKIGVVEKHMLSHYKHPFRYGNDMQHAMTQARGRYGFVVLVRTDANETFWVDADNVMVCRD